MTEANGSSTGKDGSGNNENNNVSLLDLYLQIAAQVDDNDGSLGSDASGNNKSVQVIPQLFYIQQEVARRSLFSSNESLEDVSTRSLPLLCLQHTLALAYTKVTTTTPAPQPSSFDNSNSSTKSMPAQRLDNLLKAGDAWEYFFRQLQQFDYLSRTEQEEVEKLVDCQHEYSKEDNVSNLPVLSTPVSRDVKIARFKAQKQLREETQRLRGLQMRRKRLGMSESESVDGHDEESLERQLALARLEQSKTQALDEWWSTLREIPMLKHMISATLTSNNRNPNSVNDSRQQQQQVMSNKPLQLTHITQNPQGQLQVRKEELRSQVFRPGWIQPTMSLEELAEREVADALARQERQEQQEKLSEGNARRYDQLVRDGLEDETDRVDASTVLDRHWDDWKEENPRGSGNKRANVGDRNI